MDGVYGLEKEERLIRYYNKINVEDYNMEAQKETLSFKVAKEAIANKLKELGSTAVLEELRILQGNIKKLEERYNESDYHGEIGIATHLVKPQLEFLKECYRIADEIIKEM